MLIYSITFFPTVVKYPLGRLPLTQPPLVIPQFYLTYTFVLPPARNNRRYMKQRRMAEGAKAELRENFAKDKLQTKGLHDGKLQKRD